MDEFSELVLGGASAVMAVSPVSEQKTGSESVQRPLAVRMLDAEQASEPWEEKWFAELHGDEIIETVQAYVAEKDKRLRSEGRAPFGPFAGDAVVRQCCGKLSAPLQLFMRWVFETRIGPMRCAPGGLVSLVFEVQRGILLSEESGHIHNIGEVSLGVMYADRATAKRCDIMFRGYRMGVDDTTVDGWVGGQQGLQWERHVHKLPYLSKPAYGLKTHRFSDRKWLRLDLAKPALFNTALTQLRSLRAYGVFLHATEQLDKLAKKVGCHRQDLLNDASNAENFSDSAREYVAMRAESELYYSLPNAHADQPCFKSGYLWPRTWLAYTRGAAPADTSPVEFGGSVDHFVPLDAVQSGQDAIVAYRKSKYAVVNFSEPLGHVGAIFWEGKRVTAKADIDGGKVAFQVIGSDSVIEVSAELFEKKKTIQLLPQVSTLPFMRFRGRAADVDFAYPLND